MANQPSTDPAFAAFGAKYRDDFAAFARDCIRWPAGGGLASYQEEILTELPKRKRVAPRGPHTMGKTAMASIMLLGFALTRDALGIDWKVPTTASAWRQLTKYFWPEVHKWARRLRWDKIGRKPFDLRTELQQQSLKLQHGEAFALASSDHELIEGAHADSLLYILDESKAIPDPTWDAIEGAFAGDGEGGAQEALAFAISTPGDTRGLFWALHERKPGTENWWPRHVTLEEAIAVGRATRKWADQCRKLWGENSAVYQNRVKGDFATQAEDGVIPLSWVELANERWLARHDRIESGLEALPPLERVAVDLAWGGEDHTSLARKHGSHILPLERFTYSDTMQTVGRVAGILEAHANVVGRIEITGAAGVYDRVRELRGARALAFVPSAKTEGTDRSGELHFLNMRAEAWWTLREALDPNFDPTLELPPDTAEDLASGYSLTGDLTAPKWKVVSDGKIQIQSKDELRKPPPDGIGRSTDDGDAVVMVVLPHADRYEFQSAAGTPSTRDPDRGGLHDDDARGIGRGVW